MFLALTGLCPWALAADDPFDFNLSDATPTAEERWRLSGFIETRSRQTLTEGDWLSNRTYGQAELMHNRGALRFFAMASAEHDGAKRRYRDPTRVELREAYVHYDGTAVDVTVGKQRVGWGTADGVSTIDRVNAVDLREPIGNARTAARRPSTLMRVQATTAAGVFDLVWLPRGRDRKLPGYGSPWEPRDLHALRRDARERGMPLTTDDTEADEGGIRYVRYGPGLDWGVAYYNGYTDAPTALRIEGSRLRLMPERIRTWNVNAAMGFGQSTLRGEVAWTPDYPGPGHYGERWQYVVGWDRTLLTNLYVNVQLFRDWMPRGEAIEGGTFAVSNLFFDDTLTAGLRGQWANGGQLAIEAFLELQWNDAVEVAVRAMFFDGDADTPLGDYGDSDFAEVAVRWLL
ncbi:MAG: hypothetical protein F4X99_16750 [Gammaproteobacteria bacterium]|nr:hypothetical protein [Gammaproteobacteria bacterium]